MTAPTKLNSTGSRPVGTLQVLNAENQQAEREQLNRILADIAQRLTALEESVSTLNNVA